MSTIRHFEANFQGRDFVIGNLHGQLDALRQAMAGVGFDTAADRLFTVGDLVDRCADSQACLELTQESWFHAVCGNHEDMLLEWYRTKNRQDLLLWQQYGGNAWTDAEFRESPEFAALVKLAAGLPLATPVAD